MKFELTRDEMKKLADETGFNQNPLEKAIRLIGILETIHAHPLLHDYFVLKGGTGLNLFYYDLPRLSVDVDLNYIRARDKVRMGKDRMDVMDLIPDLFSEEYDLHISKNEYALLQFEFVYTTVTGSTDKLMIDINYLHRLPMMSTMNRSFIGLSHSLKFTSIGLEELLAAKVVTLLSRYTPRDLYDIYKTFLMKPTLHLKILRSLFLYYALVSRISVFDLIQPRFEYISAYDIRRLLYPLLIRGDRPNRDEMIAGAEKFLEPVLTIKDNEAKIIEHFYSTGDLDSDTLFQEEKLRQKIEKSPALAWKIKNIKQHTSK